MTFSCLENNVFSSFWLGASDTSVIVKLKKTRENLDLFKLLVQKGYHPFLPVISVSLSAGLQRNRSVINFKMHFFNLSARCALPHVLSVSGLLCRDGIFLDEISGRLPNLYPHCNLYSRQCQFDNLQQIL